MTTQTVTSKSSKTEIAKFIRKQLKKEFPTCKFSVRTQYFAESSEISVYLMAADFDVFAKPLTTNGYPVGGHAQLNKYQLLDEWDNEEHVCNGVYLTPEAWVVLKRAAQILEHFNWDNSDLMTDYFDVNYYSHISIGKWDKPFEKIQ